MEVLETQALSTANIMIYQVTSNASMCLSFDVSSSCHHMAFGDSAGTLNLFSSNSSAMFNSFSRDTEFADPVETFPPMSIADDMACLASIPLPLLSSPLSSDWPAHLIQPGYRKNPEIDPQLLQSMKMVGTIGYAPNPGTFRRNQNQTKIESNAAISNVSGNKTAVSPGVPHSGSSSYQTSPIRSFPGAKQFSPTTPPPQQGYLIF